MTHRYGLTTNCLLIPADRPDSPDLDVTAEEEEVIETNHGNGKSKSTKAPEPRPNIKYNETVDKCLLTAELVTRYSGGEYTERSRMIEQINKYLRDDEFPTDLLNAINRPGEYKVVPAFCQHHQSDYDEYHDYEEYQFPAHIFANSPSPLQSH